MQFAVDNPYSTPLNGLFIPHSYKPSMINEIIKKPDVSLEELLEEEDFVDELKNDNPALLNYFTKNPHQIKRLVEYIIELPPDLNDNKRAHQYPLQAYEIFEGDTAVIMDSFFVSNNANRNGNLAQESPVRKLSKDSPDNNETALSNEAKEQSEQSENTIQEKTEPTDGTNSKNEDLLSYLFSFLNTKDELNPVLAGYFNRLVQKLLQRSPRKVIEFVYNDTNILFNLIDHIGQHSISELIPMILCYEHYLFDENTQERLDIKAKMVDKIFETLSKVNKPEGMVHIAETISEILHRNETMAHGKEIMAKILCKDTFDRVFSNLNSNLTATAITHVGNVILTLLGHFTAKRMNQYSPRGVYSSYLKRGQEEDPVINSICENLDGLNKFLLNENTITLSTTFGQNTAKLGLGKLKAIDIIERITRIDSRKIYKKVNETGIVQTLTNIFAKFVWNNMLHITYEKLIYTILDKRDSALMEALFEKAGFVQFIVNEFKEDQYGFPKSQRKIRKGNMGFIVKIANELSRLGGFEKSLEDQLKKNPDWEKIVVPALKARNELDNKEMGGYHPRNNNFRMTDSLFGFAQFNTSFGGGYYTASSSSYLSPQADQQPQASTPSYQIQTGLLGQPPQQEQTIANRTSYNDNLSYLSQPNESSVPEKVNTSSPQKETKPINELPVPEASPVSEQAPQKDSQSPEKQKEEESKINHQPNQEFSWTPKPLNADKSAEEQQQSTKYQALSNITSNERNSDTSQIQQADAVAMKNDIAPASTSSPENKLNGPDLSQLVAKQLQSSTDILARLKMELNISPTRNTKNKELEEDPVIIERPRKFESVSSSPVSSSLDEKTMRNSMIEMKSGKKVKLRVKKAEKLDGSKILDMINKFKGPSTSMSSSIEISYSDNSQSESGNLADDVTQPVQEGSTQPSQPSDTAAIMAQLLALRDKELA